MQKELKLFYYLLEKKHDGALQVHKHHKVIFLHQFLWTIKET